MRATLFASLAVGLALLACGDSSQPAGGQAAGAAGGTAVGGGAQGGAGGDVQGGGNTGGAGGLGAGGLGVGGLGGSGGGAAGGAQGGASAESLLVGEWKPTAFANGQNPPEPVPPDSPYFIFQQGGAFAMGCGAATDGTWVWDENAPSPALGVIHATLAGGSSLDWYVIELDAGALTFVEGGDSFFFERSTCP